VRQALVTRAWAPAGEGRLEAHASGGRPGRCPREALTARHPGMHRQGASPGGRDAALTGCGDQGAQTAWRNRLPGCTTTLRRWLKAGGGRTGPHYGAGSRAPPRRSGRTPARAPGRGWPGPPLRWRRDAGPPQRPSWKTGPHPGLRLMRYAAARVVVAPARTVLAPPVLPTCAHVLAARGLHRRAATPPLVQSPEGGNGLGGERWRFPRAGPPPPPPTKRHGPSRALTPARHQPQQSPAVQVLHARNPHRRGGGHADRPGAATRAGSKRDHRGWQARWRWATRRHPNPAAPGGSHRAGRTVGHRPGGFAPAQAPILWSQDLPSTRSPQVRGKASPMHPALQGYGAQRAPGRQTTLTITPPSTSLRPAQDWRCGLGQGPGSDGEPSDDHPLTPTHEGGDDR
jgi:RNA-directed DNA polymerase